MLNKPRALVLCGDGINCENETAYGLNFAGFVSDIVHLSDLLFSPKHLDDYHLLALPGGFSFADEIASGKIFALKLQTQLSDSLYNFIDKGKLVIGICNGFQILTQLNILPNSNSEAEKTVSLCHNEQGRFINSWVELEISSTASKEGYFKGLTDIELPIRHGEGRLKLAENSSQDTFAVIKSKAPLRYKKNVNGSFDKIAALTNSAGNVLGLMPHPEAFVRWSQHPNWKSLKIQNRINETPHGLKILQNAYEMVTIN